MKAADTPSYDVPAERLPGQFARHGRTGAPIVAHGYVQYLAALDEIDRLRAELTVANNRLGNAVGALIDAGTYCTGVDDVTAGIDRLRAELTAERDVRKQLAARLNLHCSEVVENRAIADRDLLAASDALDAETTR